MIAALLGFLFSAAIAQRPLVTPHFDTPDTNITEPIAALLNNGGQHVTLGAETFVFWWVKSLPLPSGTTGVAWTSIEPGTLVGAVQLAGQCTDARGAAVKPGTYTLRYQAEAKAAVLILVSAAGDTSTSASPHDTKNAAVFVIDQTVAAGDPRVIRRVGRQRSILLSIPVSRDGADAGLLPFGLVLAGADKADKQ